MSTASASSKPIVFYDIAARPPVEKNCFSPNPWKSRLALNFKGVPYSTSWVALPDIAKTLDFDFKHPYILVPLSECRDSEFPEYAKFNMNIDAAFTAHTQLAVQGMPFDPATEELSKAEFVRRAGVKQWDDFALDGEAREKLMESFRETLGGLAKLFSRDASGPFLLGTTVSYADMMVGAWLRMMYATMPEDEWKQVTTWHDGIFGQLHDALNAYADVK
ncbi:glutathione s-transferase [Fusarium langsethiae]|uniref:Glutathione s-transferase n=1 Tax=Fusarium langsethiae TaxID=179993 RepID=A0A0N1J2A6_FUSLA|nr:glutathione s-transferase [Fusarium langsethiae]GKU07641.1 unnamed protein product [Fusarium langsethiae]GKU12633.1 unnamed protein product [Fusarium langsethiae]